MSADNKSPFGFVTLGAAGLIALAVAASARAKVAGSPAAASSQSAAERPAAPAPACNAPTELTRLVHPLTRTARRLASGAPLVIVAVGSSSTYGAGASSPAASYPSRLAVELREHFPSHEITVLNRGVNGEETNNMMARFAGDVLAAHPQLVLWQIGTNSVLRDHPLNPHAVQLHDGIEQLKGAEIGRAQV